MMHLTFLKKKIIVIPVGILLLIAAGAVGAKVKYSKQWCSASWGTPFHIEHGNIAFPDEHGAYWVR